MAHVVVPDDRGPAAPDAGHRPGPDAPLVAEAVLGRVVVETGDEDAVVRRVDGTGRVVVLPSGVLTTTDP